MASPPVSNTLQQTLYRNKVRQVFVRNLGLGVDYETVNTLIYGMKQVDLMRIGWFATSYHVNRIYSDIFTFRYETEVISTHQGQLRGRKCLSVLGKPYVRFQGVPYAKPPIGPLRFKDPQPPEPWEGVRDALQEGPICCHFDFITGIVKGSEDCLFLNVFTPQLPNNESTGEPKAVIVWIHGGGFTIGSGNAELYSPDFFLEEDVILVTMNYRLGVLGFLGTGTDDVPGNAGLKDMVMALKWIQQNIEAFGGDPNKVCIFGESAGGAAVQYLVLSPLSKGLFSSAISMSGSVLAPWAWAPEATFSAFKLGSKFGCDTKDPKVLIDFLRKIPVKTLAKKQTTALPDSNKRELLPFPFVPSQEPVGPNAFMSDHPLEILKRGEFNAVPYITGINEMEGMITLKQILDKKPPANVLEKDFERTVPRFLSLEPGCDKSKEVAKRMKNFYFGDRPFDKKTYKEYIDLTTDTHFLDGMVRTTDCMAKANKCPIYNYEFTFDGDFGLFKKLLNIDIKGPSHADDVAYLFYVPIMGQKLDPESGEMKVVKKWVRLWSNFAKYGNPTPDDDPLLQVKWEPVALDKRPYLEINENLSLKSNMLEERVKFWRDIHAYCS